MLLKNRGSIFWLLFVVVILCGTATTISAQSDSLGAVSDLQARVDLIREDLQVLVEMSELDVSNQTWINLQNKLIDLDSIVQSIASEMNRLIEQERRSNEAVDLLEQRLSLLEQALGDVGGAAAATGLGQVEAGQQDPDDKAALSQDNQPAETASTGSQTVELVEPRSTLALEDEPNMLTDGAAHLDVGTLAEEDHRIGLRFLQNPGPPVPIVHSDAQGVISRPIPRLRPMEDSDPQPLSDVNFESLLSELTLAMHSSNASAPIEAIDNEASSSSMAVDPAQQAYDAAYGLIEANRLQDAEDAFKNFLETYGEHPLASNAGYWLGETYFARNMYPLAMFAFASNVREYGEGRKAPDALLKLSITLGVLGQQTEACRLLAFLPIEYPSATEEILVRTGSEQQKLGCM